MSTGDRKVNLFNKRVLSLEDFRDRFLGYVEDMSADAIGRVFRLDGAFDAQVTVSASVSANKVDVAAGAALSATDGIGHIFEAAAGAAALQGIKIPPDAGATEEYHVGLAYALVDRGIVTNPRTGEYEYDYFEESVGVLGTPDSVVAEGDGLRIVVNSLLESGYDHSGRTVRVWLKSVVDGGPGPESQDADVAFEEVAVGYSVPDNSVLTAGTLGQSLPSTTASDYRVLLIGPKVVRSAVEDLRTATGVFFLAAVTASASGNPITTIDHADQVIHGDLSGNLEDILETVSGHAKINVRHYPAESATQRQISVTPAGGGSEVFKVDKSGNVTLAGNLNVGGSEYVTIDEIVLGNIEVGDDPSVDRMDLWTKIVLRAGQKGDSPPYDRWTHLHLGNGDEATPGSKLIFDGSTVDTTLRAVTQGSVYDLYLSRNDAVAGSSRLILKNEGAGGKVGLQSQGDVYIGLGDLSTSPLLVFDVNTANSDWSIYNVAGALYLTCNNITDRDLVITNLGAGESHFIVKGSITINKAGAGLENSIGALIFYDQNLSADLPLTHATEAGGTGLQTAATSILGAIEEVRAAGVYGRHAGVFDDLNDLALSITGSSPPKVTVNTGSAWVNGKQVRFTSTTQLTLPINKTNYIYITSAGALTSTDDPTIAYPTTFNTLVLGVAVTNATAVTELRTERPGVGFHNQKSVITVGKSGPNLTCDFPSLVEALDWVRDNQARIATTGRPEVEVVIVGQITMTAPYTLRAEHSGLTIRGARLGDQSEWEVLEGSASDQGESAILYSGDATDRTLFVVSGTVSGVTLRDLTLVWNSTSSGSNWLFYLKTGSPAMRNLRIERCRVTYPSGGGDYNPTGLVYVASGSLNGCVIDGVRMDRHLTNFGDIVQVASGLVLNQLEMRNSHFYTGGSWNNPNVTIGTFRGDSAVIDNCRFHNFGSGITNYSTRLRVSNSKFLNGYDRVVWNYNTAGGAFIVTNNEVSLGIAAATERSAFRTDGVVMIAEGNHISITGGGSSYAHGFQLLGTPSGSGSVVRGNSVSVAGSNCKGVYCSQPNAAIADNAITVEDATGYGIHNIGAGCVITGNSITSSITPTSGITSSGNYCNVQCNRAKGGVTVSGTNSLSTGGGNVTTG